MPLPIVPEPTMPMISAILIDHLVEREKKICHLSFSICISSLQLVPNVFSLAALKLK
jgi:hypothetical protein